MVRLDYSHAILDCKIVISFDIQYPLKILTPKPLVQFIYVGVGTIETESAVTAANQHIAAKDPEFFVLHMRVTDDNYFHSSCSSRDGR
jgi:hypothetical protein